MVTLIDNIKPENKMPFDGYGTAEEHLDKTRDSVPTLAKVLLKRVKHLLKPLDAECVNTNSKDPVYCGPDFIHPICVPRSRFLWEPLALNEETTTEPHLTKLYDILSSSVDHSKDINIFVANTLSCFAGYAVAWCVV